MRATTRALRGVSDLRRREIGPVGTAGRLIVAAAALVLPATLDEFSSWDLLVGFAALPLLATAGFAVVRAGYERYVAGGLGTQAGTCCGASTWLLATVLAAVIPLAALTPVTHRLLAVDRGLTRAGGRPRVRGLRDPRLPQHPHRPPRPGRLHPLHADRRGRGTQPPPPVDGRAASPVKEDE